LNYIGDSVVGEGCSFGANTVTANWRLDEKDVQVRVEGKLVDSGRNKFGAIIGDNCRTGVNVSIMPGVKIGPNAVIGPGISVMRDVGAGGRIPGGQTKQRKG
jgi:bifunctional UDP-N-acetylglucosamine pyrophosphorylase/glucosamine-1-phosphate N-acetyltransferase